MVINDDARWFFWSSLQTCTRKIVCFSNYPNISWFGIYVYHSKFIAPIGKRLTLEGTGGAQHREVLDWNQGAAER
ncbi:hypothetical protein ES288_A01G047900v1 [Gossypium darwinii]|uniref:Uncharacterized protein n=2 Tax=Gossypium TaxID=3633 RepID=A0A5D2RQR3_GOSTO|nr:hypothetical protein ES288_A01G047900v1 [Gossypium darwinii]TYI41854.1 hypothetical protein ES332_A01G055200v1 [Gossypium tomentosum]